VFSENIVDFMIKYLTAFDDSKLRQSLDSKGLQSLVEKSLDLG